MRAFGALRGFNPFGKGHSPRSHRRQQRNKASQAGGQPLPSSSSTQVFRYCPGFYHCPSTLQTYFGLASYQPCQSCGHLAYDFTCMTCCCQSVSERPFQACLLWYWQTNPFLKAAYTSGSLSLAGDLLAQLYSRRSQDPV